jgi:hemerythrin-like metal-binding protein
MVAEGATAPGRQARFVLYSRQADGPPRGFSEMGNGRARRIDWAETLAVGHPGIDAQHREMVEIFNTLHQAVYAGHASGTEEGMLGRLLALAGENFRTEEALMSEHGTDAARLEVHRSIHRGMLQEMQMLRDGLARRSAHVNAKTLNFISKWLFEHLTHSDRDLALLFANSENREALPEPGGQP